MPDISDIDVRKLLDDFFEGEPENYEKRAIGRESSFDYCFNYFRRFQEQGKLPDLLKPEHRQTACLHLASYLASWGMYRGKSMLLQRSAKQYKKLVGVIAGADARVWTLDVDDYTPENFTLLTELESKFSKALKDNGERAPTITLTTKVILGVFGNIPARTCQDDILKFGLSLWSSRMDSASQ